MKRLVVLGCPRSGTSLVANLLSKSGFDVDYRGKKQLMGKNPNFNPDGYFERIDIVQLNDQLIRFYGKKFNFLNPPNIKWMLNPYKLNNSFVIQNHETRLNHLNNLKKILKAKAKVENELNSYWDWVIKDSRLCFTLNFWNLKDISVIKVVRNRASVKKSMENHYGNIFHQDVIYFRSLIKQINFDHYYKTIDSLINLHLGYFGGITVEFESIQNGNYTALEEFTQRSINKSIYKKDYVNY